ncbi:hypothetical protein [Paraburkholderia phytofirmans]|uniref:hypothetical protein n=1 Tax=Paraburkholderia phytofirmans TaxID=261302 RepID=UPI0038BC36C8
MKQASKLFELGEAMRKASMAAYDVNRSIQKIAKVDPVKAREFELKAIEGLLGQLHGFAVADQGSDVAAV